LKGDNRGSKSSIDSKKITTISEKESSGSSTNVSKHASQTQNNFDINMKNIKLKENVKNSSPSPEPKLPGTTTFNKIPISTATKTVTSKGINIIPIKNIQSHREATQTSNNYFSNNDRIADNRFSPKPRDVKIPSSNLSPSQGQRGKLIPIANKNLVSGNASNTGSSQNAVGFDNKISNRILTNIINNINNKSPSPKHYDSSRMVTKKSPEIKK
jgi:hypothetical protein